MLQNMEPHEQATSLSRSCLKGAEGRAGEGARPGGGSGDLGQVGRCITVCDDKADQPLGQEIDEEIETNTWSIHRLRVETGRGW